MAFPITPTIDLLNGVLCAFLAWKLHRSLRQNPSHRVLHLFAQLYVFLIFAYLAFSLPRFFVPLDQQAIGVGFLVAHVFLFLAAGYLVRVTTFFFRANWELPAFWLFLTLAVGAMIVGVMNFQEPYYNTTTGITDWNIDPMFGTLTTVIFLIVLVPSSLFFFYQGIKTRNTVIRTRSILIALGIALLLVALAIYYNSGTSTLFFISDLFSLSAFLSTFIGVYYKRGSTMSL
ncbi:MAG: hypothetical protein V1685_04570 [Parcubacteria group bacterium]